MERIDTVMLRVKSVPDVLTREQMNEFDNRDLLDLRKEIERRTVNQRFSELNKQTLELTNLVLVLTEKISSSKRELRSVAGFVVFHHISTSKPNQLQDFHI